MKHKKGMTLIEVITSMFLILLASLATMQFFTNYAPLTSGMEPHLLGLNYARGHMEDLYWIHGIQPIGDTFLLHDPNRDPAHNPEHNRFTDHYGGEVRYSVTNNADDSYLIIKVTSEWE